MKEVAYWHCGNSWGCRLQIFNNWEKDLEASTKLKGVKCILALKQQETPNKTFPTKHSINVHTKATITTRNKEALSLSDFKIVVSQTSKRSGIPWSGK